MIPPAPKSNPCVESATNYSHSWPKPMPRSSWEFLEYPAFDDTWLTPEVVGRVLLPRYPRDRATAAAGFRNWGIVQHLQKTKTVEI